MNKTNCNACPVAAGTHKPAEAVHQIQEPAPVQAAQTEGSVSNATLEVAPAAVAEQALLKVLHAIQRYMPPDGVSDRETLSEIIGIVDPWPLGDVPAAVAVPDERAAFEAWAVTHYAEVNLAREGDGYRYALAKDWWPVWQARAALSATPAAAAPVVLPEPVIYVSGGQLEKHCDPEDTTGGSYIPARKTAAGLFTTPLYTEQQVRALLAGVSAPAAQAINLLAADHSGMKVDYRGLFSQVQRAIKRSDPGYAEMLRQLEGHLQELGQRWYAGDTNVVDEILQLYCIERDARKTVRQDAAPAAQAQADARDALDVRATVEKLPRYTYGYKGDEWGMNQSLRSYEAPDGAFLRRDEVLAAIAAQAAQQGGAA